MCSLLHTEAMGWQLASREALASSEEFYDFDDKDGIIVNRRMGKRSFVLGVPQWSSLVKKFYDTFGSGAEAILFDIGKSYGNSSLQLERETDSDQQLTMNLLCREAFVAGWGNATVKRRSPADFTVKLQRCVFCSGLDDPGHKVVGCYFVRGVIAGFAEAVFETASIVEETHCGKDACEFAIKLSPRTAAVGKAV